MAIAEPKTAQLRVTKNSIIAEGSAGQIFYASPTRAKLLIDCGAAVLVNAPKPVGPAVVKVPSPAETKPAEPAEKKTFSLADQDGPLTVSASSIPYGPAEPPSSSAAAPASPKPNAQPSKRRGPKAKHTR